MARLLSDDEVFGGEKLLSDADVFGASSQADVRRAEPVQRLRSATDSYADVDEAVQDAVDRIALGQKPDEVFAAMEAIGVPRQKIIDAGRALRTPGFEAQPTIAPAPGAKPSPPAEARAWEPGVGGALANFGARVRERGRQTALGIAAPALPPDYVARELAASTKRAEAAKPGEDVQRGMEAISGAKGYGEAFKAIVQNPEASGAMVAESAALFLPVMAVAVATAPGALALAGGVGGYSGAMEYGGALTEKLQDAGIDPRDVEAVTRALSDPQFMAGVREYGVKRGLTIGTIDALTAGLAGRFLNPALKAIEAGQLTGRAATLRVARAATAEAAVQVGGGAGGEFAAQKLTGEDKPADVLFEAIAELPGGVAEVASNVRAARAADPARQFADAFAADTAERDFKQGPVDEYARRAMSPEFYDPAKVVPRAPRLEDMPTKPFTPEQVAAMRAAAPVQPAAPGPVAPGAAPPAAAPQAPATVGVAAVPQGAIAQAAQAGLTPAAAPTPAPTPDAAPVAPISGLDAPFATIDEATAYAVENRMQGRVTPAALPDGSGWALSPSKPETGAELAQAQAAAANLSRAVSQDMGRPVTIAAVPERELPGPLAAFARVARAAFSVPVVAIRGLGERGVYFNGTTFVDVDKASAPDLFIHTVGHEARHLLDNSRDAADKQIAAKLNSVIDAYLRPGLVERRQVAESVAAGVDVGLQRALDETRADVNGAMWVDPDFWGRLYDLDAGSTFRRVLYQFMRAASKFVKVAKGSRQDVSAFVTNVEAVREASAQAWAQRAKNKAARKKGGESLADYAKREGERIGGVSHLRGIVESLVKTYVNDGPEAGRAKLDDMAANVRGDTGFADEVATPGFLDELDQQLRASAEAFAGQRPAYSRDNDKPDDGKDDEPEDEGLGNFNLDRNDPDKAAEPDEPDVPEDAYTDKGKGDEADDELSDEDMAAAQAELDALQGRRNELPEFVRAEIEDEFTDDTVTFKTRGEAKAAGDPLTSDYDAVSDEAVKAAGFMAESAFPPLIWTDRKGKGEVFKALVRVIGKVREVQTFIDTANTAKEGEPDNFKTLGWRGSLSAPANREATTGNAARGVGINSITLSEPGSRALAQRFVAAPSLFARGFDLFKSVPVAARERIADTWISIAKLPKAFEFGRIGDMTGRENWRLGQRIGQLLMRGTPFSVDVSPSLDYRNRVEVTLSRAGQAPGTATIEITRQKPPRLIVHAASLEQGSNYGKPLYQIAYAMADALDAIVEADPDGLTAINTYRRTEHMLSGALRLGRTGTVQPGVGQRIYGWNPQARGEAEDRKNVVRLAVAAARNAVELFPQIETLRYELQSDRFYTANGEDAEPIIEAAMQTQDVRALSLSRSTMARAAITLQAAREGVDLTGVRELRRPVLYSRALPDDHPLNPGYVSPVEGDTSTGVYSGLEGRPIRYEVRIEDTGQVATVTVDGAQAMRELDRREQVTRQLLSCLTR